MHLKLSIKIEKMKRQRVMLGTSREFCRVGKAKLLAGPKPIHEIKQNFVYLCFKC
jgi:hypothetical protein